MRLLSFHHRSASNKRLQRTRLKRYSVVVEIKLEAVRSPLKRNVSPLRVKIPILASQIA